MGTSKSTLRPYEPPADHQTIVWVEDEGTKGKPFIHDIYDELFRTTARHARYPEFVKIVGKYAAETAVRLYWVEGPHPSS
jgi:hypothetical protein